MTSFNIFHYEGNFVFPTSYVIGKDCISVRTFQQVADDQKGEQYTDAELAEMFTTHAPDKVTYAQWPYRCFDGGVFSESLAGFPFRLECALSISRTSEYLGHSPNTDQCVLIMRMDKMGRLFRPSNRTVDTMPGRLHKNAIYTDFVTGSALSVRTDFAGQEWDQATIVVKMNAACGYKVYVEGQGEVSPPAFPDADDMANTYPTLALSAPSSMSPDAMATVNIECRMPSGDLRTDCNSEVFLEPVVGVLPKTRVKLVNGVGSFRISSMGLDAGDTIRVKAGWRYVPGLGEALIPVV